MQERDFHKQFEKLIAEYTAGFIELSKPVAEEVIKLMSEGKDVDEAVTTALSNHQFFGRHEDILMNILYQAAAAGAGVNPDKIAHPAQVKRILLYEAWSGDNMSLSARLHGTSQTMRNEIINTIKTAMKRQDGVKNLSRDLFDGYNSGDKVIKDADLPEYLDKLQKAARRAAGSDIAAFKEFNKVYKQAVYAVNRLAANDAPTMDLKTGYSGVLESAKALATGNISDAQTRRIKRQLTKLGLDPIADLPAAVNKLNQKALEKAIWVAVQEKSRYHADRIARTEMAAAYGDAFFAQTVDDPDVIAYHWQLSDRHIHTDICNFNAKADLYGLGPGVYPKDKFPRYPAHPHCLCPLSEVFEGRIDMDFAKESRILDKAQFSEAAGRKFIKSLSEQEQQYLLGVEGLKAFRKGESWQTYLQNWQGHDNPRKRFTASDFGTTA